MVQKYDLKEWGSRRRIDFLTPDTFTRKIIVVSTTMNKDGTETARIDISALNYFHAVEKLETSGEWKVLNRSKTVKEGMKFHEDYIAKLSFTDSGVV